MAKSEKYFAEYLKNIPDDDLIHYYKDLEWTPFPILVLKEYQKRFESKSNKDIIEKLRLHKDLAAKRAKELEIITKKKGKKIGDKVKTDTLEKLSHGVEMAKRITSKNEQELLLLEKLAQFRKKGIITKEEFENKKAEILGRI